MPGLYTRLFSDTTSVQAAATLLEDRLWISLRFRCGTGVRLAPSFRRPLFRRFRRLRTVSHRRIRPRRRGSRVLIFFQRWRWWQLFLNGLARELLIALRRHIHKRRDDHRHLLQVFRLQAVIDVHVGVVRARVVFDWILYELEPRDAGSVEREMVGATGVAHGQRIHAEIVEGLHPGLKDRLYGGVLLHEDAANLARAIVHVEIDGNLCLLRLDRHGTIFTPSDGGIALALRVFRLRPRPEVVCHIPL